MIIRERSIVSSLQKWKLFVSFLEVSRLIRNSQVDVSQHHITTGVEEMAEVYTVIDFDVHTSDNIRLIGISYQVL